MKMIKTIILFLFILTLSFAQAQNPGYQGKKCILSYGVKGMPITGALIGQDKAFDFNLRNSVRLEYVVWRNFSFGATYERVNDIIYLKNWSVTKEYPLDALANNTDLFDLGVREFKSAANFTGNNYGFFAKLYNYNIFGSIAPLGSYFSAAVFLNEIQVSDDGRYYNNDQTMLHTINTTTYVAGIGIQNIFYDRLTVDISFKFGLNLVGMNAISDYKLYIENGGSSVFRWPEVKMFSDYILYIGLNVGWLIF